MTNAKLQAIKILFLNLFQGEKKGVINIFKATKIYQLIFFLS